MPRKRRRNSMLAATNILAWLYLSAAALGIAIAAWGAWTDSPMATHVGVVSTIPAGLMFAGIAGILAFSLLLNALVIVFRRIQRWFSPTAP